LPFEGVAFVIILQKTTISSAFQFCNSL